MIDKPSSCMVSSHTQCNYATNIHTKATDNETTAQLPSLLSLATRVLERSKCNQIHNLGATSGLHNSSINATQAFPGAPSKGELQRHATYKILAVTALKPQSCAVALPVRSNRATCFICMTCGYRKPLCSCEVSSNSEVVICDACEHFIPDKIGDGVGIGHCDQGITWTQEYNGRRPLYRYAERHCDKFSKLIS